MLTGKEIGVEGRGGLGREGDGFLGGVMGGDIEGGGNVC